MFNLQCSVTLLYLITILLCIKCQKNSSDVILVKDLKSSDEINASIPTKISTSNNASDLKSSDEINPSIPTKISTSNNASDLKSSDEINASIPTNISTSNNASAITFEVKSRGVYISRQGRRGRRKDRRCRDSDSEEDYASSIEEYPRPCRRCQRCPNKHLRKAAELPLPTPPPPPIPPPPTEYYVSNTKMTWFEALAQCIRRGEKLATIYSEEEQKNIENEIKEKGMTENHFWIGGHTDSNNVFQWLDPPTPLNYTNWEPGEPNRGKITPKYLENEHCLELKTNQMWNDLHCNLKEYFVCQTK